MRNSHAVERVRAALHRSAVESATVQVPVVPSAQALAPDEALQVLTLAQRTAENHIAAANRHAQQLRSEVQASAERIRLEARAYADKVRGEADELLAEARAAAESRGRDADVRAAEIRRQAESALADARTEADRIVADGRDRARQLDLRAQQRHADAVGSLSSRREALQKQIEALVVFDTDYRRRLASLMHEQLRALWAGQPGSADAPGAHRREPGGPVGAREPR